ncbi:ABC transporter ATP-binding protein [Allonocardiopsis opalescens]|uniref:ABC-2 type transport system ATP-binding protein n=1 Tax=Allonocardiopsis opalescens TaxID=1144618 RepID=A0A2T0Q6G6_9ACTN|nr:ABC transporter ATP-binding protein [Allonocardiopsis opalescens]PRX99405.1 ABC-2 type transport system ATP-binding protein [Allonocardiopsis opalescens]
MATPEFAVEVDGLRMRYGPHDVLRGVDLRVRPGEVVALLGPNGAGKTTTVEILEGFRKRSGGRVAVLGTDPDRGGDAWRARLGIVLQSWKDHPYWRVRELLAHIASCYPRPRPVGELLDSLGLAEHAGKRVQQLSGGQRRRVDVALGIIGRPELLFLDEPSAGLDPRTRRDFHELVERLTGEEGVTALLTTHDMAEAERLADRIAILVGGRIAAFGTHEELAARVQAPAEVRWHDGDRVRVERTREPEQLVWRLHQAAGGPVPGLAVRRPSLEDSYLELVRQDRADQDEDGSGDGVRGDRAAEEVAA